jgi:hypothetical protein
MVSGRFWPMDDLLLAHQDEMAPKDVIRYAEGIEVGALDVGRNLGAYDLATLCRTGRTSRPEADITHRR